MLKKINYLYIIMLLAVFSACEKETDRVFDKSPDERLNDALESYQQFLLSAPNGWKATITPGNETPYHFFFKFNNANRVAMLADIDSTSAAVGKESSYRLKALQQPSLIFDTYNYLHQLADPDPDVLGGTAGAGLTSDFEFAITGIAGDTLKLIGRVNKKTMHLVKATAQEAADWENKNWARAVTSINSFKNIINYFKRLTVNGVEYEIIISPTTRTVIITYIDAGGVAKTFTSSFTFSPGNPGITFENPLINGTTTIPGLYGITFNANTTSINVTIGNNVTGNIAGAIKPIKPDIAGRNEWWNRSAVSGEFWAANPPIINGVQDGLQLSLVPGFQALVHWADYNPGIDVTGFYVNGGVGYGLGYKPTFQADGRITFTLVGQLGTPPAGAGTAPSKVNAFMTEVNGFYLVRTGLNTYDMVSAKDAKSWVSWEWLW